MSAREGFEKVSKEKFDEFVKGYDGELHTHWVGFCSPPCTEYYDERREVDDKWLTWYEKHFFMVVAYFFDEFMGIEPEYYIRVSDEDKPDFDKLPFSEQIEKLKRRCESDEEEIVNLNDSTKFYKGCMEALERENDELIADNRRIRRRVADFSETCKKMCAVRCCDELEMIGEEDGEEDGEQSEEEH